MKNDIKVPELPSIYAVETFSKCNLACPMCPTGIAKSKINYASSAINIELVKKLIRDDSFQNTEFCELQFRGEPTLHKDLGLIADMIMSKVPLVGLSTHAGTLSSKSVMDALLSLQYVTFSIDGVGDVYEKIRIGNKFDKVVENLDKFFEAKDPLKLFPLVDIQVVEVPGIDFELQKQLVQELIENHGWKAQFRSMYDTLTWQFDSKSLENKEICYNPWNSVNIKSNGDVVACCLAFSDDADLTYGNLYEESLYKIWNGERVKRMRESHTNGNPPDFCKKCNFKSPYKFHEQLITDALTNEFTSNPTR